MKQALIGQKLWQELARRMPGLQALGQGRPAPVLDYRAAFNGIVLARAAPTAKKPVMHSPPKYGRPAHHA